MRRYCPNCGRPVSLDASFCAACGSTLAAESGVLRESRVVPDSDRIPERDLGQLVSETFALYRDNLWPFVAIAMAPQVFNLAASFTPSVLSIVLSVVAVVVSVIASGAAIVGVAQVVQRRSMDLDFCVRQAILKSTALIVAFLIFAVALMGAAILIVVAVGIPLVFYLVVIWVFFPQAIMLEGDTPISALGRSRFLVRGSWWRVFGITITYALIVIGLAIAIGIPAAVLALVSAPAAAVMFPIAFAFISPITYIGLTLLYFDLRVRKEGYTLRTLADQTRRLKA